MPLNDLYVETETVVLQFNSAAGSAAGSAKNNRKRTTCVAGS